MNASSAHTATRVRRRGLRAALVPVAAGVAALCVGAGAASATPFPLPDTPEPRYETHEIAYSGADHDVTVPAWASTAYVTLVGGAGASTCSPGGKVSSLGGVLNVSGA